jgi:hypothetical protein
LIESASLSFLLPRIREEKDKGMIQSMYKKKKRIKKKMNETI